MSTILLLCEVSFWPANMLHVYDMYFGTDVHLKLQCDLRASEYKFLANPILPCDLQGYVSIQFFLCRCQHQTMSAKQLTYHNEDKISILYLFFTNLVGVFGYRQQN